MNNGKSKECTPEEAARRRDAKSVQYDTATKTWPKSGGGKACCFNQRR